MKNELTTKPAKKAQPARWPFDPMQPGDHEPVRMPEAVKKPARKRKAASR